MRNSHKNRGFTLIELSVVIVIIGLIVAGIVAGQALVRQAGMRAVITDVQRFKTALNTFKESYGAWPGDMVNATSYWGTGASGACPDSGCNGNGNRVIAMGSEGYRAWQHLGFAGLVEGNYTGVVGSQGGIHHEADINTPGGKLSNSGWYFQQTETGTNGVHVGGETANDRHHSAIFTPSEVYAIDKKLDDGIRGVSSWGNDWGTGFVSSSVSTNASGSCYTGSAYDLGNSGKACIISFGLMR